MAIHNLNTFNISNMKWPCLKTLNDFDALIIYVSNSLLGKHMTLIYRIQISMTFFKSHDVN